MNTITTSPIHGAKPLIFIGDDLLKISRPKTKREITIENGAEIIEKFDNTGFEEFAYKKFRPCRNSKGRVLTKHYVNFSENKHISKSTYNNLSDEEKKDFCPIHPKEFKGGKTNFRLVTESAHLGAELYNLSDNQIISNYDPISMNRYEILKDIFTQGKVSDLLDSRISVEKYLNSFNLIRYEIDLFITDSDFAERLYSQLYNVTDSVTGKKIYHAWDVDTEESSYGNTLYFKPKEEFRDQSKDHIKMYNYSKCNNTTGNLWKLEIVFTRKSAQRMCTVKQMGNQKEMINKFYHLIESKLKTEVDKIEANGITDCLLRKVFDAVRRYDKPKGRKRIKQLNPLYSTAYLYDYVAGLDKSDAKDKTRYLHRYFNIKPIDEIKSVETPKPIPLKTPNKAYRERMTKYIQDLLTYNTSGGERPIEPLLTDYDATNIDKYAS